MKPFSLSAPANAAIRLIPGLGLCLAVTAAAYALQSAEQAIFGRAWLEALVLAILLGTAARTACNLHPRWLPGIDFSAKTLLEVAVALLGASMSVGKILSAGPMLFFGIMGVVGVAVGLGIVIGRVLRLPWRMALLVACGNSICGNSAIAAVAPVIGADGTDVAASISFTAVLGVVVVLALPLLGPMLHLDELQYGTLAGLTVYAVPQVIAATAPAGSAALQMGTLVKLVRVLMLGPVCVLLSLVVPHLRGEGGESQARADGGATVQRPSAGRLVPWFILGFLVLLALRSLDLIPAAALKPASDTATVLTVVSMAALGLGVDVRSVARAGGRVTAAVILSLLALGAISLGFIHLLPIA